MKTYCVRLKTRKDVALLACILKILLQGIVNSDTFVRVLFLRIFLKIKSLRNAEITLLFTDIGKSCHSCDFFVSQIGILTLFAEIKLSQKFHDLQYS